MDWSDIGKMVGSIAPTLGAVLGGPLGGAAGNILASALGTASTPDDVGKAIATGGEQVNTAIQQAEGEAVERWRYLAAKVQADATQAGAINATMQAEIAKGQPWWAWRNLYGYSVGIEATATSWVILYALVFKPEIFRNISESYGFFTTWYGMRFGLLGFIHNGASNEKVAAATGEIPTGLIGGIIKAVTGRK